MYLYANMTHAEREKRRLAECTVNQYVAEWLDGYKGNLSVLTYNNYKLMADTRIAKYFQKLGVPLKDAEASSDEDELFEILTPSDLVYIGDKSFNPVFRIDGSLLEGSGEPV